MKANRSFMEAAARCFVLLSPVAGLVIGLKVAWFFS
ncbi:MAG: hypothetical protein QOH24_706 [Verrucomicrobiota bacterium]